MSPLFAVSLCCVFILINAEALNSQQFESNFENKIIQTRGGGHTCADNPARECSTKVCQSIQQRIDTYNADYSGCLGTDGKTVMKNKIVKIQRLLDARVQLKQTCFRHDDITEGGHPREIIKCQDMITKCQGFLRALQ